MKTFSLIRLTVSFLFSYFAGRSPGWMPIPWPVDSQMKNNGRIQQSKLFGPQVVHCATDWEERWLFAQKDLRSSPTFFLSNRHVFRNWKVTDPALILFSSLHTRPYCLFSRFDRAKLTTNKNLNFSILLFFIPTIEVSISQFHAIKYVLRAMILKASYQPELPIGSQESKIWESCSMSY